MNVILAVLLFVVIPALMMVPYVRAHRRFYAAMRNAGWDARPFAKDVATKGSVKAFNLSMRDRQLAWMHAELGDHGPEVAELLHALRRRQVIGVVLACACWLIAALISSQAVLT